MTNSAIKNIPKDIDIQIGLITHHHDQSILWVSFRTINTIVNNPEKLLPEHVNDFELDMVIEF